jgi:hypothetical protein
LIYVLDQSSPNLEEKTTAHDSGTERQPNMGSSNAGNGTPSSTSRNKTVSFQKIKNASIVRWNALIDRGANGSIAGTDMKVIERSDRTIDLSGLDDHTVRNLPIVTAGGVVNTQAGEIIAIIHHCADMTNDSRTIISVPQLEAFGCAVDDKSTKISGRTPSIVTQGGYILSLIHI